VARDAFLAEVLFVVFFFYGEEIKFKISNFKIKNLGTEITEKINGKVDEDKAQEEKPGVLREEIMNYTTENIVSLSPQEPVLGGSWHIIRFWFATDSDIYAEYEDGHVLRQILISVKEGPDYKVIGYFESGEDGWQIKVGEDTQFGKPLDLYERDNETGKWIKKN